MGEITIEPTQAKKDKIQFETKIRAIGNSQGAILEKKIRQHIDVQEGDQLKIQVEHGAHGPYLSLWNPRQQSQLNGEGDE